MSPRSERRPIGRAYASPSKRTVAHSITALASSLILCVLPHVSRASADSFTKTTSVTLSAVSSHPTAGDWIKFRGHAPRSWRGARTSIESRTSRHSSWKDVGHTRIGSDGAVRFRLRADGVGRRFYRLTLPQASPGISPSVSVTVFRWFYLADLVPVATEIEGGSCTGGCTGFYGGDAHIGGADFPRSYIMRLDDGGDRSTSTWNASKKCRTFDATVGLTDDSGTTNGYFTINIGGDDVPLGTTPTGQGVRADFDLRGVFRFVIAASNQGPGGDATSAWGNARVLCSGSP
jgi:hypothetical protein